MLTLPWISAWACRAASPCAKICASFGMRRTRARRSTASSSAGARPTNSSREVKASGVSGSLAITRAPSRRRDAKAWRLIQRKLPRTARWYSARPPARGRKSWIVACRYTVYPVGAGHEGLGSGPRIACPGRGDLDRRRDHGDHGGAARDPPGRLGFGPAEGLPGHRTSLCLAGAHGRPDRRPDRPLHGLAARSVEPLPHGELLVDARHGLSVAAVRVRPVHRRALHPAPPLFALGRGPSGWRLRLAAPRALGFAAAELRDHSGRRRRQSRLVDFLRRPRDSSGRRPSWHRALRTRPAARD